MIVSESPKVWRSVRLGKVGPGGLDGLGQWSRQLYSEA
jgi:hypothetical protein